MDRLSNITTDRLTDLSQRLFATKPTVAAVGPVGSLPSFQEIRGGLGGEPGGT